VVRHSLVDGTLQVAANVAALRLTGAHALTRACHDVAVTFLLTETHSEFDLPWALHNLLPKGVLGGPRRHRLHHRHGDVYFQQFFCYLDDAFGYTLGAGAEWDGGGGGGSGDASSEGGKQAGRGGGGTASKGRREPRSKRPQGRADRALGAASLLVLPLVVGSWAHAVLIGTLRFYSAAAAGANRTAVNGTA